MTEVSPYIAQSVRRAALPVSVHMGRDIRGDFFSVSDRRIRSVPLHKIITLWNAGWPILTSNPREATAAYLRCIAELERTA